MLTLSIGVTSSACLAAIDVRTAILAYIFHVFSAFLVSKRGIGHIYSQSEGPGFQKCLSGLCPQTPVLFVTPIPPLLSSNSSFHTYPVGKISVHTLCRASLPDGPDGLALVCGPVVGDDCSRLSTKGTVTCMKQREARLHSRPFLCQICGENKPL